MLPFSVILWRLRSHHFIMAEVRNFKTLVQNEGLDPIGEIQTGINAHVYMSLLQSPLAPMQVHPHDGVWCGFISTGAKATPSRTGLPCPVPKRWKFPLWKFLWNFLTAFVQVGNMATMAR